MAIAATEGHGRKRILAMGEAKWQSTPMAEAELDRLVRIREILKDRSDADASQARILLFSPRGFTTGLTRRAKRERAELVDLERLYRGS